MKHKQMPKKSINLMKFKTTQKNKQVNYFKIRKIFTEIYNSS